jgi:hypothetical protein
VSADALPFPTPEQVTRFRALFAGAPEWHGKSVPMNEFRADGKRKVEHRTAHEPMTDATMTLHLQGGGPVLGAHPLHPDGTVRFAGLDIDDYRLDLHNLAHKAHAAKLPLVVTRSTSGGAHCYVFFTEPVDAGAVVAKLTGIAAWLLLAHKAEIFPKQTSLVPGEFGNFMSLPYHDAARPIRYGFDGAGVACDSFDAFLDHAESQRTTGADFLAWEAPTEEGTVGDPLLAEAPPCLQTIRQRGGLVDGTKREGMFSVLVYLRKRFPDAWEDRVDEYNTALCSGAGLKATELLSLTKSLSKKATYTYKCKTAPLQAVCQRGVCLKREFGISNGKAPSESSDVCLPISQVTCYMPAEGGDATWRMTMDGQYEITVSSATLMNKDAFNLHCLDRHRVLPISGSAAQWIRMVTVIAQGADVIRLPAEQSREGALWVTIEGYLVNARAKTMAQVATGGVLHQEDKYYFKGLDLLQYLDTKRIRYDRPAQVWNLLRDHGGDSTVRKVDDASIRLWCVPAVAVGEHVGANAEAPDPVAEPDTGSQF